MIFASETLGAYFREGLFSFSFFLKVGGGGRGGGAYYRNFTVCQFPSELNLYVNVTSYRLEAHPMQHVHNIFSSNIPGCTLRIWTTTKTADRGMYCPDTQL